MRGALAVANADTIALTRPRTLAELVPPFLRWFELVRRRMPNTVNAYHFDLARFLAFCEEAQLTYPEDVSFRHTEFFLGWIQTVHKVAPRSANRHLHSLRSFWRWMVREGLATVNPAAETFMLPTEHRLPTYLTVPEQERVLATLARGTTLRARRDYALIATGLLTGLRCSELAQLRVAHLDLEAGVLRVVQGKNRKDREVPVVPRLAAILRTYLADVRPALRDTAGSSRFLRGAAPSPYVFSRLGKGRPGREGQELLGRTVFKIVREVVSPIVGRKIAPHTLRHSFATRLREHGADLQLIQEALGHASITTTVRYAHIATSKRRQDLARLLEGPGEGS
jgi:site-specific recombinase XerD